METNNLVQTIEAVGLESQTSKMLHDNFFSFFAQAEEWKEKAIKLVVTDVSQVAEMKLAREARLALKDIRVNADKKRKELKEDSLRYGQAVQSVYNLIENQIKPIEKYLEEQERFPEIQEAKRKADLRLERQAEISPFSRFVPYQLDLGELSQDEYQKVFNGAKLQMEAEIESQRKAQEERLVKEKLEAEERERVRVENLRLKQEAIEREKQINEQKAKFEKQRKEIEAKAKKERLEAEAKIKKEKEEVAFMKAELERERERKEEEQKEVDKNVVIENAAMPRLTQIVFSEQSRNGIILEVQKGIDNTPSDIRGNYSDGYHTFNELYEFRKTYNAALFNEWAKFDIPYYNVHKSIRHHDGEYCFGGGWFIVVAVLPTGQISTHYEMKDWDLFKVPAKDRALFEFDGHTSADVLARLNAL